MKKFAKILVFIVAVALVFGVIGVSTFAVDDHSDGITLYLKPNSNWTQSNARFAVYTWDGGDKWFNLTSAGDGYYTVTLPAGISNIIFCRMNPSTTANNWNNKWNQTADLKVQTNGNNCYTVAAGAWDKGGGTWSKFTCAHTNVAGSEVVLKAPTCTETGLTQYTCSKCGNYTVVTEAKGHTYTNNKCTVCGSMASYTVAGANSSDAASIFGTAWDTTNTANDMTYDEATGAYTKVYTNVPAGTYNFKCARDYNWNTAYPSSNEQVKVSKSGSTLTITLKGTTVTTSVVAPVAQVGDNYFFNLQDAVDAAADGDTVVLHADYTGDIYFTRAADVDVTINGNGKTFNGTITIDGKSATYATGSLTIENVRFDATGISKAASINFGVSGNNNTRYITNVSIIKCTFTGGNREKAAIKSYTGGDKNITVAGCSVDNTMHSLLQVTNVTGLEIDACTVNSKNGINLNNSSEVVIKNSAIEVSGYAVRAGASSQGDSGSVELTNNTLKTDNSEGDPVIELRGLAQKNIDLVMSENVVSGNVHIKGTTDATKISAEANYWDGQNLPSVNGAEFYVKTYYATPEKTETELSHLVATLNGVEYDSLEAVFADAKNGDEIIMVTAGTYKLLVSGKSITVTASVDGVAFEGMGAYGMGGANVTFNNITFNWTNENYKGLQHSGNLVYNNCTINGQVFLYGNSEIFNECTFNQTSAGAYNVWTYGAKHVEFNKCTFNSAGKALLVYTESSTHFIDLAITETTFNASAVAAGKAAIEIDTSLTAGANISIDAATTANGFDAGNFSGNTLWNNKKGNATDKNNDIIITVAGEEVLAPLPYEVTIGSTKYTSIQAAIDAAKSGDEISIYNDLVLTNSLYINNKTVTINLNKHTLTYGGTNLRAAAAIAVLTNNATLIVKGNGTVLTNGAIFSIEDGSEVQIVDGTYDVDVTPYLAEGYRVATAPQADGTILYGVVTNTDKTFIGENGNWWVGEYDTGIAAQPKVEIIEVDGVKYWHVNGINTGYLVTPTDAVTPEIKVIDGVWHIDIKDGNGFQSTSIVAGAVDGNGIVSIEKTESNGLIDIYTITYNDGTTTMFTIQNGSNGANGPTGPDGAPGNQGPKGDRGQAGANGASNTWFVNSALYIALGCIALAGGVVLVLNYKRTHWWG